MTDRVFVDTNVLVYARDFGEPAKQPAAAFWMSYLWASRRGALSFQVLQEFYVTVTQKLKPAVPAEVARREIRRLTSWGPVTLDAAVVEGAWRVQDRYSLSFWDALIISACQVAGCPELLTEDLADGENYAGVRVINPFFHPVPPH